MELIPRTCTAILAAHLSLWRCMSLLFPFTILLHLLKFLVFSPCYIAMAQNQDIRRSLLRSLASLDSVHHLSQALHNPGHFLLFLVFLELAPILGCHRTGLFSLSVVVCRSPDTYRASFGQGEAQRRTQFPGVLNLRFLFSHSFIQVA